MRRNLFSIVLVFMVGLVFSTLEDDKRNSNYFEKDDGLNTEFPPIVVNYKHPDVPTGHLRPIGYQRSADKAIKRTNKIPSPVQFYHDYVSKSLPYVFDDVLDTKNDLFTNWDDKYLMNRYGILSVNVIRSREADSGQATQMSLIQFLLDYRYRSLYLATVVPEELMDSLQMPPMLTCGPASSKLTQAELWLSAGGTASYLHDHQDHQLHCLVEGRKDFIIFDPKHRKLLHMEDSYENSAEGHSKIHTEMVNMIKHGSIAHAPWQYATLHSGQCIFIPAHFAHQVRSYGRSLSYTLQWRPTMSSVEAEKLLTHNCPSEKSHANVVSLDKFSFMWTMRNGIKQLSNRNLNSESVLQFLLLLLDNQERLPFARFSMWYLTLTAKCGTSQRPSVELVWHLLRSGVIGADIPQEHKDLNRQDIERLSQHVATLDRLAKIFNLSHCVDHDEL